MNIIAKLLADASAVGFVFEVTSDGEVDYRGRNAVDAAEAIEAVDEAEVRLYHSEIYAGENWVSIINDCDGSEKLADFSGLWINMWYEENT